MPDRIQAPPTQPSPPTTCNSCGGAKGRVIDTSSGGVRRQHWQSCQTCSGKGVR